MFFAASTPPRLITLILATATSTVSLTMFVPSLQHIAQDFAAPYAVVNLAVAGYLAATALLQLIMGPLSDRYGRRPVLLFSIGVFTLASLGAAFATDIWVFLGLRLAQGVIISGWALSQAAIRDTSAPKEAASRMGYVAMAMAVAPITAPMFGGLLDGAFGWRASFHAFALMGALLFALAWLDFGETNAAPSSTFRAQFRAYPELLRTRRFWTFALCMAFSTSAFYAFLSGVPLVAQTILDVTPDELGLYLGSITGGYFLGSFVAGRYAKRFDLAAMMVAGRLAACTGLTLGLILVALGIVTPLTLFGATVFVGIGNGITMPSASAGALSVRPHLAGSAAGLAGALVVGMGFVVTALTGAVVTAQTGAAALLAIMLACSGLALVAALDARREMAQA